ncbi:MAG: sodium/proline symporter [Chlamydiota bacterium]|nr:sodium/proline symporter [Chlamydiota bacterium]
MIAESISALMLYLFLILAVAWLSYQRQKNATDFILGGRKMNFWVTAFSAHASDMSSWLFMGFPLMLFQGGLSGAWMGIGLILFMAINWYWIAPALRRKSADHHALTLSSFFEKSVEAGSGRLRMITALICMIFYTAYVAAGMTTFGIIAHQLLGLSYSSGMLVGSAIMVPYLFFGGFRTLAWVDSFQALYLFAVIVAIPPILFSHVGGWPAILAAARDQSISLSFFPSGGKGILHTLMAIGSWGLGYFGQPHVLTKFMGIQNPRDMKKAMAVGLSWQVITLGASAWIGLIAIPFFQNQTLMRPDSLFPQMIQSSFSPFIVTMILCALFAATLSTADSQLLILGSCLAEDCYKPFLRPKASSREILWVSRFSILLVTAIAYQIASYRSHSIYHLVQYGWSGLGATFGPLLLFTLFDSKINQRGAWAGVIVGGIVAMIWPLWGPSVVPTLIPAFSMSSVAIYWISRITPSHPTIE